MKKIIALILAVMMLGSVSVFAADLTVGAEDDVYAPFLVTDGKTASQHTDLWLQVEAAGQIDVTVPLLLVFKTNIDGGAAEAPTNYDIMNKSTAPLAVTQVVVTYEAKGDTNPMTLTNYDENSEYAEDHYGVQLSGLKDTNNADVVIDLAAGTANTTARTYTHTETTKGAGLFVLPKATIAEGETEYTASETNVVVDMGTGKLSFVTKHDEDGDLDEDQGVKLLSIAYTVAIKHDDASAKGTYMKGSTAGTDYTKTTDDKTATYAYDYTPATNP